MHQQLSQIRYLELISCTEKCRSGKCLVGAYAIPPVLSFVGSFYNRGMKDPHAKERKKNQMEEVPFQMTSLTLLDIFKKLVLKADIIFSKRESLDGWLWPQQLSGTV